MGNMYRTVILQGTARCSPLHEGGGRLKNGGENMTGSLRLIFLSFLVSLLLSGCGLFSKSKGVDEVELTPAEEEKSKLLKKIDRKFENPEAHFELGQLYQADGLWVQAENEYNITLSFDPAHRRAQAAMVKVLLDGGDTAKGELSAEIFMNQVSGSASGSRRLGVAFQKEQLDDYALACYRQALRLAPNSASIKRQIGYYFLSKGDEDRARDYLIQSFDLNPNQPEVAGELGRLGVPVRTPRKTEKDTKKLDKAMDKAIEESE